LIHINTMLRLMISLSLLLLTYSHPSEVIMPENMTCADLPPFQSYHIHVLFWQNNKESTTGALALRERFMSEFGLSDSQSCDDDHLGQPTYLCMFYFNYPYVSGTPFLTSDWSAFVPVSYFAVTVPWIMSNRGPYDVLVHPNSGCEVSDHRDWPLWGGNKWELDLSIMSWNCPGCDGYTCAGKAQEFILPGLASTCGLSATAGGPFTLTDRAAYCTTTCKSWVMQVEKLFTDCPRACHVVEEYLQPSQQDLVLCNSYSISLNLFQQYSALC